MKIKNCLKCGNTVSKNCKLGFCGKCRDRSGKNNPFFGKTHSADTIDAMKQKVKITSENLWKDQEYRDKVILGISKPRRNGFKQEQSVRIKKWYQENPNQKNIRSQTMKQSWLDGKIEPNINSINESKDEKELRVSLATALPNITVQKKTIKIGNKWFYPDVMIDKRLLVEFFGDYWHGNPLKFKKGEIVHHGLTAGQIWKIDAKRIKTLEDNGFKVMIVWQNDYLLNKNETVNRIVDILNPPLPYH